MKLVQAVYLATGVFPKAEMFGLTSQMRRAAVSVPSNIAEGHGRLSDRSLRVFLSQARGSLFELVTQIELARNVQFLEEVTAAKLIEQCDEVAKMLHGLLRAIEKTNTEP